MILISRFASLMGMKVAMAFFDAGYATSLVERFMDIVYFFRQTHYFTRKGGPSAYDTGYEDPGVDLVYSYSRHDI